MNENKRLEQLYIKYKDTIYNFVVRLTTDPDLAMDITQQTFLTALNNNQLFVLNKSWFIACARNIVYSDVKYKLNVSFDIIDESTELNFVNEQHNLPPITKKLRDLQNNIETSIHSMSIKTKEIMILYFSENLSIFDISEITQRSIIDIKVNLHHARVLFEIRLINEMKGKVISTRNQCRNYSKITNLLFQNDIPKIDLKIVNDHISNCKRCIQNEKQLKQTGMLFNLTPLFNVPAILDKSIYNALESLSYSANTFSKNRVAKIFPFIVSGMIVFITMYNFSANNYFNTTLKTVAITSSSF